MTDNGLMLPNGFSKYIQLALDVTTIYDFSEVIETSALCNTELYELTELATKYFSYTFYRHHSMTVDNAIATLINGYRHSPKE